MKTAFFACCSLLWLVPARAQSNNSDGNTPIIIVDDDDEEHQCHMVDFKMPCCIDTYTVVKDVAKVTFEPAPCKESVTFSPAIIEPMPIAPGVYEKLVTATADDGSQRTQTVQLVNSSIAKSRSFSLNFGQIATAVEELEHILSTGGVNPCRPSTPSKAPSVTLSSETSNICCSSNPCVKQAVKISGTLEWGVGILCHFPVLGVPYTASLDVVLSAGASIAASVNAQTTCSKTKICANLDLKTYAGGGVGATALANVVQVDAQLIVSLNGSGQICFTPPPVQTCAQISVGTVKIVGTLTMAWGLSSHTIDYVLFNGCPLYNGCF